MTPKAFKSRFRKIVANKLTIDRSYQREPITAQYRRIARNLDFDALGVLHVSKRNDGSLMVVDGWHRVLALREQQVDEWEVSCQVYSGLTIKEEAQLYRLLNTTRKPSPWDDFKAGLRSGDSECAAINRIAGRNGWRVSNFVGPGRVACVAALRNIFRKDDGALALDKALCDAKAAWGGNPTGVERYVLTGLSVVHTIYDGCLDRPAFIKKLAKVKGGPAGILVTARQLKEIRPESIARLCAWVIVQNYNKGRRSGQLPPL